MRGRVSERVVWCVGVWVWCEGVRGEREYERGMRGGGGVGVCVWCVCV